MKSAIEECEYIDTRFLCELWDHPDRWPFFLGLYSITAFNKDVENELELLVDVAEILHS